MTAWLYIALYAGAAAFLAGCVARAWSYARLPLHLRWELYPVPHEAPERAAHGGSYFEELDWWKRPRRFNLLGELAAMIPEMLFMKALHEFNRKLWYRSFLFHFGLYLIAGTVLVVLAAALLTLAAPSVMAGGVGAAAHWVCLASGAAGAVLSLAGALALLIRRLTDADLSNYTTPGDLFNLSFFLVAFGVTAAGYFLQRGETPGVISTAAACLTFNTKLRVPGLFGIGLALCAALAAYIPMTHMAHFIAKYFTYHYVRWDDAPVVGSPRIALELAQYLTYRPTWSAPHVTADGVRTWADVARTNPWEGGGK